MGIGFPQKLQTKDTYWGSVEWVKTCTGMALKKIRMNAGSQSSLEYHLKKHEVYWLLEGELRLELRDGQKRGENSYVILRAGDCWDIPPGVMHQRKAITDVVILEACSEDRDYDTYIVEDGRENASISG